MSSKYKPKSIDILSIFLKDFDGVDSPNEAGEENIGSDFRVENGFVTMSENMFAGLKKQIEYFKSTVDSQREALDSAMKDMVVMRQVAQDVVTSADSDDLKESFMKLRLSHDDGYFNSYSGFGIHHVMLSVSFF